MIQFLKDLFVLGACFSMVVSPAVYAGSTSDVDKSVAIANQSLDSVLGAGVKFYSDASLSQALDIRSTQSYDDLKGLFISLKDTGLNLVIKQSIVFNNGVPSAIRFDFLRQSDLGAVSLSKGISRIVSVERLMKSDGTDYLSRTLSSAIEQAGVELASNQTKGFSIAKRVLNLLIPSAKAGVVAKVIGWVLLSVGAVVGIWGLRIAMPWKRGEGLPGATTFGYIILAVGAGVAIGGYSLINNGSKGE